MQGLGSIERLPPGAVLDHTVFCPGWQGAQQLQRERRSAKSKSSSFALAGTAVMLQGRCRCESPFEREAFGVDVPSVDVEIISKSLGSSSAMLVAVRSFDFEVAFDREES